MNSVKNFALLAFPMLVAGIPNENLACSEEYPFISADWYGGAARLNPNGVCSGNGNCTLDPTLGINRCFCNPGYTGLSDLINTEGIDCQINELAIKLEWAFIVILACVFNLSTLGNVIDRIKGHKERRAQRLAQGKKYTIWKNNRTLVAMFLNMCGCFPSIVSLGLLRIIKEDERAGVTFGYSFLFFMGKLTFYTAALIYQPALLASLLQGGKSNNKKLINAMIRLGYISQYSTYVLSIAAAVAPLIILADVSKGVTELAQIVYIVYFILQIMSMVILSSVAFVIKRQSKIIFSQSYSLTHDERTKLLQKKVDSLEKKAMILSFVIGIVYLVYTMIPTLWNKHDYVFPLTWIPFVILGREINNQHIKERHGSSSKSGSKEHGSKDESAVSESDKPSKKSFFNLLGSKKATDSPNYVIKEREPESVTYVKSDDEKDDGYV